MMDVELNVTYITLGGHVEVHKYRYLYFVIMFTIYILILCSNSTIVYLIVLHRNLHEPMYIFIAALSVNSILFATVIYPKLLFDFLSEKQIISHSFCFFLAVSYYSLAFAEFLLLSAMAYDRYVSICKPLQYATIMRKATVNVFLVFSWLVPVCETVFGVLITIKHTRLCSFTLKGIFCNNSIYTLHCVRLRVLSIYGVLMFINVALLPVIFILFTYSRILIITSNSSREDRRKAAQTCLPHLLVLISFSCFVTYDVVIVRLESDIPKTARFIMSLQIMTYHPLFNPIIYGLKMKEISKHLKKLFCHVKSP